MIALQRPKEVPRTLKTKGKQATYRLGKIKGKAATSFSFDSSIYAAKDVRESLRKMHHGKCAFCESPLPQSTAGHVEHFRPKGEVQQDEGSTPLRRMVQ